MKPDPRDVLPGIDVIGQPTDGVAAGDVQFILVAERCPPTRGSCAMKGDFPEVDRIAQRALVSKHFGEHLPANAYGEL